MADDTALALALRELSPQSRVNYGVLLRTFGTEVGQRRFSFGYSVAAAPDRWLHFASARDSDELIGYAASVMVESFGQFHGLITELVVLPEYRHQGVAQSLIAGISGTYAAHQGPRVSRLAAIVPAKRHEAQDAFIIAGFEVIVQGDEYLFQLPINHRAPAHC
jgi:ribosomal protein S18 acetylase RimI-like enzyme